MESRPASSSPVGLSPPRLHLNSTIFAPLSTGLRRAEKHKEREHGTDRHLTTTRKTALGQRTAAGGLALILSVTGTRTQLAAPAGAQTGAFHATRSLSVARAHAAITVLRDGRALVARGQGANGAPIASA